MIFLGCLVVFVDWLKSLFIRYYLPTLAVVAFFGIVGISGKFDNYVNPDMSTLPIIGVTIAILSVLWVILKRKEVKKCQKNTKPR